MILRPPAPPPTRMDNLVDFRDTVRRGDTLDAMRMQQMPPMPPPTQQMSPEQMAGLTGLPVQKRFLGGIIGSVIPALVGGVGTRMGLGAIGTGGLGLLGAVIADKIMGKKTDLKKNLLQGLGIGGMAAYRGTPLMGGAEVEQGLGYSDMTPDPRPSFGEAVASQFDRDNLPRLVTDMGISGLLGGALEEPPKEEDPILNQYVGKPGNQVRVRRERDPDDPYEYSVDAEGNPIVYTQEELLRQAQEGGRKRMLPRYEYITKKEYDKRQSDDSDEDEDDEDDRKQYPQEPGIPGDERWYIAEHGGRIPDFEGRVPGRSDGMEDDVYMPIIERARGKQIGTLAVSPKEYVLPADVMSILGNGNPDAGADAMDQFSKNVRQEAYGTPNQQKELDGLQTIQKNLRG